MGTVNLAQLLLATVARVNCSISSINRSSARAAPSSSPLEIARAICGPGAARRASCDQMLEFAAYLEPPQLVFDVDLRDDDAAPRQDREQPLAREPLQRFADRRAPDAKRLAQSGLRHG